MFKTLSVAITAALLTSTAVSAASVTVLAGNLPPMMNEDGSGREAEIIREVLNRCGHDVIFKVQPFTRHWASYEAGAGDAVATVPVGMALPGTQTGVYIQYQNGVSALASNGGDFSDLNSLSGQSIIGFLGASEILPGLKEATGSFSNYQEAADQIVQSRMVFAKRVDAVIGDGMIFAEFNRQLRDSADIVPFDVQQEVRFQAVFAPSDYVISFRDEALSADFDRCFTEAQGDGTIAGINARWVEKYRPTLTDQYLGY